MSRRAMCASWIAVTAAWAAALFAVPWWVHTGVARAFVGFVWDFCGNICHQRPDRSIFLWGAQMPVCARCTGVYLGALAGGVIFAASHMSLWTPPSRSLLLCSIVPLALDWGTEWLGWRPAVAWLRVVTGLAFSTGATFALIPGVAMMTARLRRFSGSPDFVS